MTKTLLITRPRHDIPVEYLYDFTKDILKKIKTNRDIHVSDLQGDRATRERMEFCLVKENPGLVFCNGHGDKETICGHHNEPILDKQNIHLGKNKIIYALACDCLEELGPYAINKGIKAFIGYGSQFMIIRDKSRTTAPDKDKNALPFKKVCFTLIEALVFGKTVSKAMELTKRAYENLIKSYGTSDDNYGDIPLIRFALTWNLEFLGMEGDPEAFFS